MNREWHACSQTNVLACIDYAAHKYAEPVADLERVAWCESRDEPTISNGVDDGLFEFAPATFAATAYGQHWIYSARWNALAAAWAWAHGWGPSYAVRAPYHWSSNQWECV